MAEGTTIHGGEGLRCWENKRHGTPQRVTPTQISRSLEVWYSSWNWASWMPLHVSHMPSLLKHMWVLFFATKWPMINIPGFANWTQAKWLRWKKKGNSQQDSDSCVSPLSNLCKAKGEMKLSLALVGQVPVYVAKIPDPCGSWYLKWPAKSFSKSHCWDSEARLPGLETQIYHWLVLQLVKPSNLRIDWHFL